jgi:hypothetical protein
MEHIHINGGATPQPQKLGTTAPTAAPKRRTRRKPWGSYRATIEQRAAAAALLTRHLHWSVKQAASVCCVNKNYIWLARRLSPADQYRLSHNRLALTELEHDYRRQLAERRTQRSPEGDSPTDAGLDELIGRYGAERIMAALDRVTAPQRAAAE